MSTIMNYSTPISYSTKNFPKSCFKSQNNLFYKKSKTNQEGGEREMVEKSWRNIRKRYVEKIKMKRTYFFNITDFFLKKILLWMYIHVFKYVKTNINYILRRRDQRYRNAPLQKHDTFYLLPTSSISTFIKKWIQY